MGANSDNLKRLYQTLKKEGFNPPQDFNEFVVDMQDDDNLGDVRETLLSRNYTPPEFDLFKRDMFGDPTHELSSYSTINDAPMSLTANSVEKHQKERLPIHGVDYSTAEDAPEPEWDGVSDEQLAELRKQSEDTLRSMRASTVESQDRILNMGRHQSASINNETVKGGLEYNPATGKVEQTYITPTGDKTFDKTVADMVSREHRKMIGDWKESQKQPTIDEMVQSAEHEVHELTAARDKAQNNDGVVFGGVPGGVNVRSYSRSPKSGINTETDKRLDLAHSKLIMANQMKRLNEQGEKFGKGPGFKDALKSWQGFKDGTVGNLGKFANGIIDWFTDPDIMGVLSMSGFAPVKEVAEKMDAQRKAYADAHGGDDNGFEPSLSADEKELMDYFMRLTDIESKEETSMAFTVGRAIPEIVALGVQLAYNPAAGTGRMAQTATKEAVKGFSKAAYRKGAEYAARALGDIAEGVVAAGTTQLGSTLGRAEKIAAGGSDNAFGTALMSQASGNFGLMAGKYFAPVGQAIWKGVGTAAEKAGMGTVKGFVDEVLSQTTKNGAADFAKSLHLTGTIENTLGAKLGEALNGVTAGEITFDTDSEHGLFNAHRFAETLTEFAILDGVMKGYHAIGYRTPVYRAKIDMEAASNRASLAFGDPRVWQSILTSLKGGNRSLEEVADQMRGSTTDNPLPGRWSILEDAIMSGFDESVVGREGVKLHDGKGKDAPQSLKAVYDILSNPRYTNEQRGAALDFVRAAMRYDGMRRGIELNRKAQETAVEDVEYSEVEAQRLEMHKSWEAEYERGRLLMEKTDETSPEAFAEVDAVASRMQDAYRGIEDAFGSEAETIQAQISVDPWIVLDNQDMGYDQREAVVEFINAKAALDGVNDASEESLERKRMAAESEIASRTHKDRHVIQPITMTGSDQQVYVVKGDIAQASDGSVDVGRSSDFIVVYNPATGEYEFTSAGQIDRIDDFIDPKTELDETMRIHEEQHRQLLLPENTEEAVKPVSEGAGEVVPGNDGIVSTDTASIPQNNTALSRIPVNEQGKPDFAAAETPDVGWDGLVERYRGNEQRAQGFADNMVAIRKNELAKAQKIKSKPTEDPDEWDASELAREAAIDKAQAALDAWSAIAGVAGRRKAEHDAQIAAERAAREAMEQEAERLKAEEEALWEQQKKKLDSRLRDTAEKYRDMPEVLQILEMNTPTTIDEVASVVLSTNKVLLNNTEHGNHKIKVGAKHHAGLGKGEQRKLFGLFASEAKGGKSLERLAEDVFEETCQDYGVPYDNGEALNALIDMIRGANTIGDIRNYITDKRIREAERMGEARRAQEMEAYDKYCQDAFGMSGADYDAYEEQLYSRIMEQRKDFDEQEFYRNIADDILNEQRKRAEDESRSDIERVEGVDPAGAVEAHGGSGEVLPGAPADHTAGVAADGRGSEISSRNGRKEYDQRSGVSGEASRGSELTNMSTVSDSKKNAGGEDYDVQELDNARKAEAEDLADKEADLNAARNEDAVRDVSPEAIDAIDDYRADMEHEVDASAEMTDAERSAANVLYTEPTEAQKAAGNYKMEHRKVDGHNISIENPKGSVRRGVDASGKEWETEMHNDYGYIRGKKGVDGDHIDVFLSDNPEDGDVFVIDQTNADGTFDEHKVMYGFPDEQSAREAYLSNYEEGWTGLGAITHVSKDEFKKWIKSSKRATKPFTEYKSVTPIENHDIIGRSLSEQEATHLITQMEANAEVAPVIELTPENWEAQFGEDGTVETPIGVVKMGENQYDKMLSRKRNEYFGMIHPTLNSPDVILEEADPKEGSERDSKYLFVKTFVKSDGSRIVHFESVTVKKDGMEVSISSHEIKDKSLKNKMQNDIVLHLDEKLSPSSEMRLTEAPSYSEGPDLVPTSNNMSSDSKDKSLSSNKQAVDTESSEADKSDISGRSDKDESSSGVTDIKRTPIEDFGEKILGARKDMLHEFSKTVDSITEQALIELPLSKVLKRPNLKKMVDNGAISEDDATLAEAVMQALIYAEKKPALTRRLSSKREIASWAKRTHSGVSLLRDILSGDADRRARAMDEYKAERSNALEEAKMHLEKIRGWNQGKTFKDVESLPDPVEVMVRVLKGIGYRAGDKVELPLCQIGMDSTYQSYTAKSQGKQGALWFDNYYATLDDAVNAMIKAGKLAAGHRDVELPQKCISVRGEGAPIKRSTGEFEVSWLGRGTNILYKTFKNEEEAKAFAAEKNGIVKPKYTYTGEYESYKVVVTNPLTGNRHDVKVGFATRSEADAYMDESHDEINALSLDAIYTEMGTKGKPRDHFYIASSWNRRTQKTVYSVYSDDKNNPWPLVKDFNSRDEAVKWFEENKERLEAERREEIKKRNSIVYFDNTAGNRVGVDHRNGKDADAKMYEEAFGFRGVQFGNWTNDADRQAALNQAYDGFMDMANALGLSPRAMSLDGELGLAFGARGNGSAMAHYEPVEVVINLTKTMGAGSLAHEWWHALDNYLSRKGGVPMGYLSHGNGTSVDGKVAADVIGAMIELTDALKGTPYMNRSEAKGDYWGRKTEVTARLFAEWINYKLSTSGGANPFLSRGIRPQSVDNVRQWNYMLYKASERMLAEREGRTPNIMSYEDFTKDPRSLNGHPYPTIEEVKEFAPYMDDLFGSLASRESESGSMARDAGAAYKRKRRVASMAGRSLFDDMPSDDLDNTDRQMRGNAEMANTAIDAFSRDYMDYLDESQKLEQSIESLEKNSKEHDDAVEHLEFIEQQIIDSQRRLEESLSNYYHDNGQSSEDARRSAHDMLARVRGEVEVRRKQNYSLKSLLPDSRQTVETLMQSEVPAEPVKRQTLTAGGDTISYEAVGHLPEIADGEFAWVERQFSTTGEFAFTGNERIRSRDDVAYLFRSLENYSIEHAFAVLVKDGKPVIVHLGMGTANASLVDNKAVRAAYDAFGADKIYFVHNHPSGVLTDSVPDRRVLATMSSMFKDSVEVEAIIIDTTSGQYSVFGAEPSMKADRPVSGDNVGVSVHRFDRQAFSEKPELEVSHIKSSEDIARFVSAQRLGRKGKVSYLVLSNQLEIVGHFHTTHSDLSDTKGLGDEIASTATKYGGMSVAIYGNMSLDGIKALSERISQSSGGIKTVDAVSVNNGLRTSAYDEGLIGESEPEYGLKNQDETAGYHDAISEKDMSKLHETNEAMEARAIELAAKYNTKINVVRSSDEVALLPSARRRNAKGWFDPMARDGENAVTVVLPNHANVADVENTVVHEIIAHKGLRDLVGRDHFDTFLDEIHGHVAGHIREKIDAATQKMVNAETRRLANEKGGGVFAEAEARVKAEAKRTQFMRDATEEYMADMAERIGDSGFEKMDAEELTLWGRIKAKIQKLLEKAMQGVKWGKHVKLSDKDLAYILYRSWKKARGKKDMIADAADDAVMRMRTGYNEPMLREITSEKKAALRAEATADRIEELFDKAVRGDLTGKPIEVGRLTSAGKAYLERLSGMKLKDEVSFVLNPSDLMHMYRDHFGDNEKDKGNNIPLTKDDIRTIAKIIAQPEKIVFGIEPDGLRRKMFYFLSSADAGTYNLLEVYSDRKGNLTTKTFFKTRKAVSQRVLSLMQSEHLTSVTDGASLSDNAKLPKFFEYPKSETDNELRFRDGDLGFEEAITKMKTDAMQANAGNLQAKQDAMRAIGGNLSKLRQAMARQKEYDLSTVKSVTDLARVLMDAGLLDELSKYETKRILGAVDGVLGKTDVSKYVQKVFDIMVDNQLRKGSNDFGRLLGKGRSNVNARGIEVQGELDADGQRMTQVVKKNMSLSADEIDARIADAMDRMASDDVAMADNASIEYAGLQFARRYAEDIARSRNDEKSLRDSINQAKEEKNAGQMSDTAYRQYVEAAEDAIRQNKIERAEAYNELIEQLGGTLSESIVRAKTWRDGEKYRIAEIHHNANSDMEGRPADEHHKDSTIQKTLNNSIARFMLAPLGTFDQMLRIFGNKSVSGEGYLWNRFMRQWTDSTEQEYIGYRDSLKELDAKVSEVFGKKMKWGDLISMERGMKKATVTFWDGGKMKEHQLTQGNLLYIYMANKMSDGRMKLRRMGIEQEDVDEITKMLDPRFVELADWMQEEFLVEKRNKYNEVHKRMFGASMSSIDNYFPLKILANARLENVDVADDTTDTALPATSTGSIIKRTRNNLALDVTGADAFSVVLDHIQEMERWAAFAEFNRDLNTLLSYKHFRNQVMNMSSVYGSGKTLWNNFRNVCSMAAGAYRPPIASLDKAAVNIAKGVTAAKVSFRMFTALKQFLSMPAYLPDSNPAYLAMNIANPIGTWQWAMKELPLFEKRWQSRMSGDPRLMKSEMDWKMWRNRVVEIASRIGMSPNAFVDALTVSIGAHTMYQTRRDKYIRQGYNKSIAEKRAKQDATILFNQTQQSSESAFLSTMQVDRSWLSVLFTVFRNSSMSYTRQLYDALRNISRKGVPGYRALTKEFMAKQMMRDGIAPEKADQNARRAYRTSIIRDLARIGIFGFVMQYAWNIGAYMPYLLLGDDDEEKDAMLDDVINHTAFGSIEGLTGGDVMSSAGQMWLNGEGNMSYLVKDMPIASDLSSIFKKWSKDEVAAMNDVINLFVQSSIGVNPQSLTDAVVAVLDYCGDDANTSRECALLIARILNCPPNQLDKIYFDELGVDGLEASKMSPAEIAERYAAYKTMRNAPLTGHLYSDEQRDSVMNVHRKKAQKIAKDNMGKMLSSSDVLKTVLAEYDRMSDLNKELAEIRKEHPEQYRDRYEAVRDSIDARLYRRVGRYKHDIKELTEAWLKAGTVTERDSLATLMRETRDVMLEDVAR